MTFIFINIILFYFNCNMQLCYNFKYKYVLRTTLDFHVTLDRQLSSVQMFV